MLLCSSSVLVDQHHRFTGVHAVTVGVWVSMESNKWKIFPYCPYWQVVRSNGVQSHAWTFKVHLSLRVLSTELLHATSCCCCCRTCLCSSHPDFYCIMKMI